MKHAKNIIIVDGLWGCGKTTLAKQLAKKFGCPLLVFDEYRERIFDSGSFPYDKNHPDLNKLCKEAFIKDLNSHLSHQNLVLLEWDFEQDFLEQDLRDTANKFSARTIVVHLFADIKTRLRRALARLKKNEACNPQR